MVCHPPTVKPPRRTEKNQGDNMRFVSEKPNEKLTQVIIDVAVFETQGLFFRSTQRIFFLPLRKDAVGL